jgi:P27 family predicted phage terminase small subunit
MAGRRPKPTHLHKLQGTFNATRHGRGRAGEPIAEGDLHSPPRDLTPAQKDVWRYAIRHAPRGLLKRIDRDVLAVWCEARDRWNTARLMQAKLDASGELKLLIKGPLGLVESPYNSILEKTAKTMLRCATELGFSPAARPRLQIDQPPLSPDPDDPWQTTLRLVPAAKRVRIRPSRRSHRGRRASV